jgi:hypothetical protein
MLAGRRFAAALLVGACCCFPADRAAAGPDEVALPFYEGYYLEREEGRPEEALVLYLQFLRAAPDHVLAPKAARFAYRILVETESGLLEGFVKQYGHLVPPDEAGPGFRTPEAMPKGPDAQLLEVYENASALGQTPPELSRQRRLLGTAPGLLEDGRFMDAVRVATNAYRHIAIARVATMVQAKVSETNELRRRLAIQQGFGEDLTAGLQGQIGRNQQAIDAARTDAGLYEQIAKLYPEAVGEAGKFGLLGLVLGMHDPTDSRFRAWLQRAHAWLRDLSLRPRAGDDQVRDAIEAGKEMALIDALLQEPDPVRAKAACERLWRSIVGTQE